MTAHIVTANRLADGAVVFRSATGWSTRVADALVHSAADAPAALQAGEADVACHLVVGTYLVEVEDGPAGPVPLELRERIRAAGPTVGLPGAAEG